MKKIVLIEDDSDLFALLKYNLEKEGFGVAGAQTGRGAIELCRRERPDLLILDIMLPDSDGLEICKGLRNHSELAHVPIIFMGSGIKPGRYNQRAAPNDIAPTLATLLDVEIPSGSSGRVLDEILY